MGIMATNLSERMLNLESKTSKLESVQASQAQQIAHLKLISKISRLKVLVANLVVNRRMQSFQRQHHSKGKCDKDSTDDDHVIHVR
ncbi:hypothetical protein N7451_005483 [Penicillium sp. IBT 35674x]|nr:hypothetical protein N7451_005483 [Penicillium sp. IBT 35674x]